MEKMVSYIATLRRIRFESFLRPEIYEDDFLIVMPESESNPTKYAEDTFRAMARDLLTGKDSPSFIRQSGKDFNWGDYVTFLTREIEEKYKCYADPVAHIDTMPKLASSLRTIVDVNQDEVLLDDYANCFVYVMDGDKVVAKHKASANMTDGSVIFEKELESLEPGQLKLTFTEDQGEYLPLARNEEEKEKAAETDPNAFYWVSDYGLIDEIMTLM